MSNRPRRPTKWLVLFLAGLACATIPGARVLPGLTTIHGAQAVPSAPRFTTGADLVSLDVCVRDRSGRPVDGLAADDFIVLDNGAPQRISLFAVGPRLSLAVALVIDRSSSMAGVKLERARQAALAFLDVLQPDDLLEVVTFNERAERPVPFGSDRTTAAGAIAGIRAEGQTGLYEALLVALRDLQHHERAGGTREYRHAVVLLTDGEDTSSRVAFEDTLEDVRRGGALVYGLSLRVNERDRTTGASWQLTQLAMDSGGVASTVWDPSTLDGVFRAIAHELRHLYRLGYAPSALPRNGAWRSVSVRLVSPDLRARMRSGYYAPRPALTWSRGSQP